MNFHIPDPDDKLAFAQNLNLSPEHTIVVGDGYTDLPLLNWSSIPVMIDRSGQKRKRFTSHDFYFISSIPELINIIQANIAKRQSSRRMKNKKLIVFDMDGVLIDVSRSYRDTVRQTAALFFKNAPGYEKLPEPFFPLTDLAAVKQSGGLNNDWDLSCLVINLLFDIIEKPPVYKHKDAWDRYRETISQCDVTPLAEFLNSTPNPLSTLHQKVGLSKNSFIYGLYSGDVSSGNIIKQIFQEVYLGQTLFEDTYRMVPQFYRGEGFNQREQLIINRNILEELAANHILAIATGRPRSEADYPLDHFELRKYFSEVLTLEDCLEEEEKIFKGKEKEVSLSKPHPFMLDAIAYRLKRPVEQYFYIGDMPDDMVAAKKSQTGYKGIGFILTAPDKESLKKELQRAGADTIIEDIDQLISFIASA